jgi:hypothetical protein
MGLALYTCREYFFVFFMCNLYQGELLFPITKGQLAG